MTLKLTEQQEECGRYPWTVLADLRNRDDAKVAVVSYMLRSSTGKAQSSSKAKRKAADGMENEGEPPKKTRLLSQAEQ